MKAIQRPVPRGNSNEWHGLCQKIGQFCEEFSAPVVWEFTYEQLQDSDKMTEYLQGECCGNSKHEQLTAVCRALATLWDTGGQ